MELEFLNNCSERFPFLSDELEKRKQQRISTSRLVYDGWLFQLIPDYWKICFKNCNNELMKIQDILTKEYEKKIIYPPKEQIFNAFTSIDLENIKVVIIGQDPYFNGSANGLAFSVGCKKKPINPSLINIFQKIENEFPGNLYVKNITCGNLENWKSQGVLLLNSILTVEESKPKSHENIGWNKITDEIISFISKQSSKPIVFMLWGRNANDKKNLIDSNKHLIISTSHPSPLSCEPFFKTDIFSRCNSYLLNKRNCLIEWWELCLHCHK